MSDKLTPEGLKELRERLRTEAASAADFYGDEHEYASLFKHAADALDTLERELSERAPFTAEEVRQITSEWEEGLAAATDRALAAEAGAEKAESLWTWLASREDLTLDFGYPDVEEPGEWQVHRVSGNRNDREWDLIASGATPLEAFRRAAEALAPQAQGEGKNGSSVAESGGTASPISESPCQSDWRPIASAPRPAEGEPQQPVLLAWFNVAHDGTRTVQAGEGYWHATGGAHGEADWWWANTSPGDYYADPIEQSINGKITHWMPLPTPPEGEA